MASTTKIASWTPPYLRGLDVVFKRLSSPTSAELLWNFGDPEVATRLKEAAAERRLGPVTIPDEALGRQYQPRKALARSDSHAEVRGVDPVRQIRAEKLI